MVDEAEVDRDLLARVRAGDDFAYGELFSRHADAVRRFCLRFVREPAEADDLTAEAFFRVLQAIRRGAGPTDHVRTYLLTVARRVAWEWNGRRRDVPVEDEELSRRVEPCGDNAAGRAEQSLIARAFTSLPERWRTVLWRVEVEGERPSTVAPHFGLSPNAMAALARRAREGLRAAYLQAHLADDDGRSSCAAVRAKLGTYTAGGVQGAEERRIRKHLQVCASCATLYAELTEVCSTLRAHAPFIAVPATLGLGLAAKGTFVVSRAKLALAAASVATIGLFGVMAGVFTGSPGPGLLQPDQNTNAEQVLAICTTESTTSSPVGTTSSGRSEQVVALPPPRVQQPVQQAVPAKRQQTVAGTAAAQHQAAEVVPLQPPSSSSSTSQASPPTTTSSGVKSLDTSTPPEPTTSPPPPTTTTVILYPTPRQTPT